MSHFALHSFRIVVQPMPQATPGVEQGVSDTDRAENCCNGSEHIGQRYRHELVRQTKVKGSTQGKRICDAVAKYRYQRNENRFSQ